MNKKGFVLVETIITSVFVLGLFAFIVANILPIIGVAKLLTLPDDDSKKFYLFDKDDICVYLSNENYCRALLSRSYLDVKEMVITSYEIKDGFVAASKNFDRGLREYIAQMQKYKSNIPTAYNYANRLIVYFNDGRMANIEILFDGPAGGVTC